MSVENILDFLPNIVWQSDLDGRRQNINAISSTILGRSDIRMEYSWLQFVHEFDRQVILDAYREAGKFKKPFSFEYRMKIGDDFVWFLDNGMPYYDKKGNFIGFVGTSTNINEQKNESLIDHLTKIYNRRAFDRFISTAIGRACYKDQKKHLGLIYGDINYIKGVNDNIGHAIGDRMIKKVAEVLFVIFRRGDAVCRLGGDEFAVLLPEIETSDMISFLEDKRMDIWKRINKANKNKMIFPIEIQLALGYSIYKKDVDEFPRFEYQMPEYVEKEAIRFTKEAESEMYKNKAEIKSGKISIKCA